MLEVYHVKLFGGTLACISCVLPNENHLSRYFGRGQTTELQHTSIGTHTGVPPALA